MFKLVRYFGLASLLLYFLAYIPASFLVSNELERTVKQVIEGKNVALSNVFLSRQENNIATLMSETKGLNADEIQKTGRFQVFDQQLRAKLKGTEIRKVHLHSPDHAIIYSTEREDIGLDDHNHHDVGEVETEAKILEQVFSGEVVSDFHFNQTFEKADKTFDILASYIPIRAGLDNDIVAVMQIETDISSSIAQIDNFKKKFRLGFNALSLILILVFALLVTKVEDILKKQYQELEAAKEKLERQAQELMRSNEELELFAYTASHDLQEPLRKVQAFGDRLAKKHGDVLGEGGLIYLDRMQDAAARMRILIQDLLAYSRVNTQGNPFVPVDLNLIVKDVLSDLEVRISQSQAIVSVAELPKLEADPLQMRQLFQNLIGNALKFHKQDEAPVVTVLCEQSNSEVVITVKDNGVGFDNKYAEQVFKIFQRLHGRGEFEGTGMGLAIVRKIVERHGGTIQAESKEGEGASFIIRFSSHQIPETIQTINPKQTLVLKPQTA